jgi:opacity protein-like surface antigen
MNRALLAGLAALGVAASGVTFAQGSSWNRDFLGYVGASAGESKFRADCAATNVFACDKRDTAWKIYTGGRVNEIFGFEIGYTDFGKIKASGGDTKAWAVPLSVTAGMPLGDRFNIFAKLGGVYARTDVDVSPTTLLDKGRKNGWGGTWGAGASFKVAQNLDIRVDWDRYRLDFVGGRNDVDVLSGGVQFRF